MKRMNTYQRILVPAAAAALLAGGGVLAAPADAATSAVTAQTPTTVYVYATDVHLREWPNTHSVILATVSHIHLSDWCQTDKNTTPVADPNGGTNPWWSRVTLTTGSDDAWVSNVFLQGGRKIAGVPDC